MTDKEIIIDGVDVAGCEFYSLRGKCREDDNLCKCDSNCDYAASYLKEQLQALKTENEALKRQNVTLQNRNQQLNGATLKARRYKQALNKIEEICKESFYAGINYDIESIIKEVKNG